MLSKACQRRPATFLANCFPTLCPSFPPMIFSLFHSLSLPLTFPALCLHNGQKRNHANSNESSSACPTARQFNKESERPGEVWGDVSEVCAMADGITKEKQNRSQCICSMPERCQKGHRDVFVLVLWRLRRGRFERERFQLALDVWHQRNSRLTFMWIWSLLLNANEP